MMIRSLIFWLFEIITGLSALAMFAQPRRVHESLVPDPGATYKKLGFSPLAVEMVHNVIRGQGAALLAISIFLVYLGPMHTGSFLLIAIASTLTLLSHLATARHHAGSPQVMAAIGSLRSLYALVAINAFFALMGTWLFFAYV